MPVVCTFNSVLVFMMTFSCAGCQDASHTGCRLTTRWSRCIAADLQAPEGVWVLPICGHRRFQRPAEGLDCARREGPPRARVLQ